jgi:hypothetical protein
VSDISKVISRLEQQRASIDRAIAALREVESASPVTVAAATAAPAAAASSSAGVGKKNRLSAAGRRRIAEAAKRYWAQKRAEKAAGAKKGK